MKRFFCVLILQLSTIRLILDKYPRAQQLLDNDPTPTGVFRFWQSTLMRVILVSFFNEPLEIIAALYIYGCVARGCYLFSAQFCD